MVLSYEKLLRLVSQARLMQSLIKSRKSDQLISTINYNTVSKVKADRSCHDFAPKDIFPPRHSIHKLVERTCWGLSLLTVQDFMFP